MTRLQPLTPRQCAEHLHAHGVTTRSVEGVDRLVQAIMNTRPPGVRARDLPTDLCAVRTELALLWAEPCVAAPLSAAAE